MIAFWKANNSIHNQIKSQRWILPQQTIMAVQNSCLQTLWHLSFAHSIKHNFHMKTQNRTSDRFLESLKQEK